jgi:peptidoglycan hydrolase CwlO-like protein
MIRIQRGREVNEMKKSLAIAAVLAVVLFVTGAALAQRAGYGPGRGAGWGPGYCWNNSGNVNIESVKKFQKETQDLRNEMMVKRAELSNEYNKETPDEARITALQNEIDGLRTKIQKSAEANGLAAAGRGPGAGRGYGPRNGSGPCGSGPYGCARW